MIFTPRTDLLRMQVPQVPQITDNDFIVLCYLYYANYNGDKTIAVRLENGNFALLAHTNYKFWHDALNSPNAGIKDGETVLQNMDPDKLTSKIPREAREAIKNKDIKWIKNHWRNSKNIYRNGGGKEPWYIFKGENAYLICGIIITLAFEALFELTKDGDEHCSAGMLMWFVEVLSKETKDNIRAAGEKFLDGVKSGDPKKMQEAKWEANEAINEELFEDKNPTEETIYKKLKEEFFTKIAKKEDLPKWINGGFDGFDTKKDVCTEMKDRMNKHFKEKYPNSGSTSN
ncbi:MAG: hypothetical protein IKT06_02190 [Aeriscardovia sp.]|nr:hypothetical protein [Aeriscardovia sp.]